MIPSEKGQFFALLAKAMAQFSKPLPKDVTMLDAWWSTLSSFPIQVVAAALSAYCDENGEFAPIPAGISKRCKLMDGRPTDEEAWAMSLVCQDEASTVVWTQECAEAFGICRPILTMGDEVGARMAFKDAYNRLVSEARRVGRAAVWSASLGWDLRFREAALKKAVSTGLLPAPDVAKLLPPPIAKISETQDTKAQEQLRKIKEMMSEAQEKKRKDAEKLALEERDAIADRKLELAKQAKAILPKN